MLHVRSCGYIANKTHAKVTKMQDSALISSQKKQICPIYFAERMNCTYFASGFYGGFCRNGHPRDSGSHHVKWIMQNAEKEQEINTIYQDT